MATINTMPKATSETVERQTLEQKKNISQYHTTGLIRTNEDPKVSVRIRQNPISSFILFKNTVAA